MDLVSKSSQLAPLQESYLFSECTGDPGRNPPQIVSYIELTDVIENSPTLVESASCLSAC